MLLTRQTYRRGNFISEHNAGLVRVGRTVMREIEHPTDLILENPADYDLAKTVVKRASGFHFTLPAAKRSEFMAKVKDCGFVTEQAQMDTSLMGKILGRKATEEQIALKTFLSSRAAFVALSSYATLACGEQFADHKFWRANLKRRIDIDRFEADYRAWVWARFERGDASVPEPEFSARAYPSSG